MPRAAALLLTAMAATPMGLAAQESSTGWIQNLVTVEERAATLSSERPGELGADDLLAPNGQRVQAWTFQGELGQGIRIDLMSSDFDAYLYLAGPGFSEALFDDDGGADLDSRLCMVLPATGTYRIVAGALGGGVGQYRLSVEPEPALETGGACPRSDEPDLLALPTDGRVAAIGDVHEGILDFDGGPTYYGSPVQAWAIHAARGEEITMDLRSEAFDAYLHLVGPGLEWPLEDDDGAGGCDARITFTAPEAGDYRIILSSLGFSGGAFTLSVHAQAPPVSGEPCVPDVDEELDYALDRIMATVDPAGRLVPETAVEGLLGGSDARHPERGGPMQLWTLEGKAGDRLFLDLVSLEFDAYLFLAGPGLDRPLLDDDGAGCTDARIEVLFPEDAIYSVIVTTFGPAEGGRFRLVASETHGPGRACE